MIECINGCGLMSQTFYEGVEIDICQSCAGVWLDAGEITSIVETRDRTWPVDVIRKVLSTTGKQGISLGEKNRNISCPKCRDNLPPVNYQNSSGIVVNSCQNGHGMWLDAGELAKIQIYMEQWDFIAKENSPKHQKILREIEKDHVETGDLQADTAPSGSTSINRYINRIVHLLDQI